MKFAILPWFIRSETISLVIEDHPKYCLVNREWANYFVARYGKLFFMHRDPSLHKLKSPFTQLYKKVWFYRDFNIDWEIVYALENIFQVAIEISKEHSKDCSQFISNCLQLPLLTRLKLQIDVNATLDFKPILSKNRHHLKELCVESNDKSWYSNLGDILFPNLSVLKLSGDLFSLETVIIRNCMPKLNKLKLSFPTPPNSILFKDQEMPNITELELDMFYTEDNALPKLDLTGLPNLKKLHLCGSFLFSDLTFSNKIEELDIGGSAEYLSRHLCSRFTNLEVLRLSIDENPDITELHTVFHFFQRLTELHINFWFNFDHLNNLPEGPYNVINLSLKGRFALTSNLLRWLSDCFKLRKLTLHGCYLEVTTLSELLPFDQLSHLTIYTDPKFQSQFESYFSRAIYPNLMFIEIRACCCLNLNIKLGLEDTIPPIPSTDGTDHRTRSTPLSPTDRSDPHRGGRSPGDKLIPERVMRGPASSCCLQ